MDLIDFFGEEQFDASEYVRKFFENNSCAHASARCDELEGLRRQTEESLRQEVVRNYQTFMHATAQIQSMEKDIDALRSLLSTASSTLKSFETVRLVDRQEGTSKQQQQQQGVAPANNFNAQFSAASTATSLRGLKLPEWLDKAPTELEELLLERKHEVAVKLIRQVKGFAANVRNATNLGRGVAAIFAQADDMAAALSRRLISEITGSNTFTAWGFREHKKNFQLLIDLGYADAAAAAFVKERSSLIRRSLHMVEATADPLAYVHDISAAFFSQALDTTNAFLRLFCGGGASKHESRAAKVGKSAAFVQIYFGVRESGAAPFCRLVTWLDHQIDNYARLIGRQIRAAGVGTHALRAADAQLPRTDAAAAAAPPPPAQQQQQQQRQQQQQQRRGSSGNTAAAAAAAAALAAAGIGTSKLDPATCTLFATVSVMLEEAFTAAARLHSLGFPVGVPLCAHLTHDMSAFIDSYCRKVDDGVTAAVHRDELQLQEYTLLPPEVLLNRSNHSSSSSSSSGAAAAALSLSLTTSAAAVAREVRDVLEYTLLLIEPPCLSGDGFDDGRAAAGYYYGRQHFVQLQSHIVNWVFQLISGHSAQYVEALRSSSAAGSLTRVQAAAASSSLEALSSQLVPAAAQWCEALLPEVVCAQAVAAAESALKDAAHAVDSLTEALPYVSVVSAATAEAVDDDDDVDDMAAF